jgi:mRNA-degrading endonuclease YafQ of YafQ-DinJ toxin-antitoxin module
MFEIIRNDRFIKTAKKFLKKHPDLKEKFKLAIQKLEKNPFEPSLKLHKLQGNLEEFYAVRLTYEYRIILILIIVNEQIILIDIGTHDDVY